MNMPSGIDTEKAITSGGIKSNLKSVSRQGVRETNKISIPQSAHWMFCSESNDSVSTLSGSQYIDHLP